MSFAKFQSFCFGLKVLDMMQGLMTVSHFWVTAWSFTMRYCGMHWGWVMHIYASVNYTIIGLENGLLPTRCWAIISTKTCLLLIWALGTNFNEILLKFPKFHSRKWLWKCCLQTLSRPQCLDAWHLRKVDHRSYFELTIDRPYLTLTDEIWGACFSILVFSNTVEVYCG